LTKIADNLHGNVYVFYDTSPNSSWFEKSFRKLNIVENIKVCILCHVVFPKLRVNYRTSGVKEIIVGGLNMNGATLVRFA